VRLLHILFDFFRLHQAETATELDALLPAAMAQAFQDEEFPSLPSNSHPL
jgi:hypothetical protein